MVATTLDFDALDQVLARPDVSAYLLCSPHNPVGIVWSIQQLTTIAELCQRHDVQLLVDEIHAPLTMPEARYVPFGSIDHAMTERAYVFSSASKGWNIAGLKCGVAVAGGRNEADVLAERWEALLCSHLGLLASVAAFARAERWLDAMVAQIDENRAVLAEQLHDHLPGVRYIPGSATFLAWLDCRSLGLGDDPAATFLDRGRVALSPGRDFGEQGRRICEAQHRDLTRPHHRGRAQDGGITSCCLSALQRLACLVRLQRCRRVQRRRGRGTARDTDRDPAGEQRAGGRLLARLVPTTQPSTTQRARAAIPR